MSSYTSQWVPDYSGGPVPAGDMDKMWDCASTAYGLAQSGYVAVYLYSKDTNNSFFRAELPALRDNPSVSQIRIYLFDGIKYPAPGDYCNAKYSDSCFQ